MHDGFKKGRFAVILTIKNLTNCRVLRDRFFAVLAESAVIK